MRPMDMISIVIGFLAIGFALVADRFYAGLIKTRTDDERTLPRWFGRAWFIAFGVVAISNGLFHWL